MLVLKQYRSKEEMKYFIINKNLNVIKYMNVNLQLKMYFIFLFFGIKSEVDGYCFMSISFNEMDFIDNNLVIIN